jgi:hypothetical protein
MKNTKYRLTNNAIENPLGVVLYQIEALKDIGDYVKKGDLGGYIEKEENLSVYGEAWVSGEAQVYGEAWVSGEARVYGEARVSGKAQVYGQYSFLLIDSIGSRNASLFVGIDKNKDLVICTGCFTGDEKEFLSAVKETHGNNIHAQAYKKAIEFAKTYIQVEHV